MKSSSLTPVKLRLILAIGLFLIAGVGAGVFYFANKQLSTIADSVSHATADASASQHTLQTLQTIQSKLDTQKDAIQRANDIAASSQSYNYQNQIISDLNTYASRAGVTITNIDFSAGSATGGASGATSTTTPTTPAAGATSAPAGLKTATVSVTLSSPVDYTKLLNFFNMLEQSIPKMQIAKVNLSKSSDGGGVASDVLSIEVYIR